MIDQEDSLIWQNDSDRSSSDGSPWEQNSPGKNCTKTKYENPDSIDKD